MDFKKIIPIIVLILILGGGTAIIFYYYKDFIFQKNTPTTVSSVVVDKSKLDLRSDVLANIKKKKIFGVWPITTYTLSTGRGNPFVIKQDQ